jgi:hypothetical protein
LICSASSVTSESLTIDSMTPAEDTLIKELEIHPSSVKVFSEKYNLDIKVTVFYKNMLGRIAETSSKKLIKIKDDSL